MEKSNATGISLAGQRLRQWRMAQNPPISVGLAAHRLGVGQASLYGLETGARTAGRKIMKALVVAEICEVGDFFAPALPEVDGPQRRRA